MSPQDGWTPAPLEGAGLDAAATAAQVRRAEEWLAAPHAYFRAFSETARAFQRMHPSPRHRVMTFVAAPADLLARRPVLLKLEGRTVEVDAWDKAFAVVAARLMRAYPRTFEALQFFGHLAWMGCPAGGEPAAGMLARGALRPGFASWEDVVRRLQWLLLVCGIKLNDACVLVDPYASDAAWAARRDDLKQRRQARKDAWTARRAGGAPPDAGPPPRGDAARRPVADGDFW